MASMVSGLPGGGSRGIVGAAATGGEGGDRDLSSALAWPGLTRI